MPIQGRRRLWPGDGASAFPADPLLSALDAPAFWDAAACPYVVILGAAPPSFATEPSFDPARWTHRLDHRTGRSGGYYIFCDGSNIHRIWLFNPPSGGSLAAVIPRDGMTDTRLQAVSDLERWLRGITSAASAARPTSYQSQRLDLLLSILDLRAERQVASHEVARRLIYPRMDIGRGAAWKSSPERRRTQRLIREAEALAAGGYRALLTGRGGRQK
jgi:hypothetical protein